MHRLDKKQAASCAEVSDCGTARLIDLCVDQIKVALDEAFAEIDALSGAVLDSARHANALLDTVKARNPDINPANESASGAGQALQQAVQNAYSRLQFADRLNQRLSNVSTNLTGIAELMQSNELSITGNKWTEFLKQTRRTFTMESERQMFDALFAASVAEVSTERAMDAAQRPTAGAGEASNGR